nr:hypothetical protein Iba_chr03bCG16990 [Ipomoea batatas]
MQQSVTAARRRRRSEQLGKKGHPLKSGDVGGGRGLEALHHLKPPILSGFKLLRSVFFSGFFAPPQTRGSTVRGVQVQRPTRLKFNCANSTTTMDSAKLDHQLTTINN